MNKTAGTQDIRITALSTQLLAYAYISAPVQNTWLYSAH